MNQALQLVVMAVVAGLVIGIAKAAEFLLRKREQTATQPNASSFLSGSEEVTGKVTPGVCSALRRDCQDTLKTVARKGEEQSVQLHSIRESQVRTEGEIKTLVPQLTLAFQVIADKAMEKHEERYHSDPQPPVFQGYERRSTGGKR